jgi:predicted nuclease of predicted toxin-antitoxin system
LLDTAFAHPSVFIKLKSKTSLKHVRHNYNLPRQAEDKDIYQLATKEDRFVVTIDNDFTKLVKPKQAGIILINAYLSNDEIDKTICNFISGKNPDDFKGIATKI